MSPDISSYKLDFANSYGLPLIWGWSHWKILRFKQVLGQKFYICSRKRPGLTFGRGLDCPVRILLKGGYMKSEENLINNKMWLHNYIENIDSELDKINQVKKIFTDSIQTGTICGANGKQCARVGKLSNYKFSGHW